MNRNNILEGTAGKFCKSEGLMTRLKICNIIIIYMLMDVFAGSDANSISSVVPVPSSSAVSSTAKINDEEQLKMKVKDMLNQKYGEHIHFFKNVYAINNFDIGIGTRAISICFDRYKLHERTVPK